MGPKNDDGNLESKSCLDVFEKTYLVLTLKLDLDT